MLNVASFVVAIGLSLVAAMSPAPRTVGCQGVFKLNPGPAPETLECHNPCGWGCVQLSVSCPDGSAASGLRCACGGGQESLACCHLVMCTSGSSQYPKKAGECNGNCPP